MKMYRDLIRDDIRLNKFGKQDIIDQTNQAKHLLISRGAKKGDIVNVSIPLNGIKQLSFVLACLELGLPLYTNHDDVFHPQKQKIIRHNVEEYIRKFNKPFLKRTHFLFQYVERFDFTACVPVIFMGRSSTARDITTPSILHLLYFTKYWCVYSFVSTHSVIALLRLKLILLLLSDL
mgnify:CR=1 FL=1